MANYKTIALLLLASPLCLADDLLDLEALMATDVKVTSAMKRAQNISDTSASIYVLDQKELKSSGVTSIPQALTLVPGLQARKINNNQWAISMRNAAGRFSSKLLVMIDGQSLYNPTFAGVYWEDLNVPIYDIERIEVIRGQGGLLWGSNATNGVINIITKNSIDTQSTYAHVETGSDRDYMLNVRTGVELDNRNSLKLYARTEKSGASERSEEGVSNDNAKKQSIGGRFDYNSNSNFSFFAQADYTHVETGQLLHLVDPITKQNSLYTDQSQRDIFRLLTRLEHNLSDSSSQMLQLAYSYQNAEEIFLNRKPHFYDLDYQMNLLLESHQLDWGLNYRYNKVPFTPSGYITATDPITSLHQYGGFIQGQFSLIPEKLLLVAGVKAEHNDLTGWEYQPSLRLNWQPATSHSLWAAISRGVRTPSLAESSYTVQVARMRVANFQQIGIPAIDEATVRTISTNEPNMKAETSISSELGYRYSGTHWSTDLSLFHTSSQNALTINPEVDPRVLQQFMLNAAQGNFPAILALLNDEKTLVNLAKGDNGQQTTQGGEVTISWQPVTNFTLEAAYSLFSYELEQNSNNSQFINIIAEPKGSAHQFMLKTSFSPFEKHHLFTSLRVEDGEIYETDDFTLLDLNWTYQALPQLQLNLTATGLLAGEHLQFDVGGDSYTVPTYQDRSVNLGLKWEFE